MRANTIGIPRTERRDVVAHAFAWKDVAAAAARVRLRTVIGEQAGGQSANC